MANRTKGIRSHKHAVVVLATGEKYVLSTVRRQRSTTLLSGEIIAPEADRGYRLLVRGENICIMQGEKEVLRENRTRVIRDVEVSPTLEELQNVSDLIERALKVPQGTRVPHMYAWK